MAYDKGSHICLVVMYKHKPSASISVNSCFGSTQAMRVFHMSFVFEVIVTHCIYTVEQQTPHHYNVPRDL